MALDAASRTLPWQWYSEPALYDLERERIFSRFWQYAAHTGQVAEPGSFVACHVGHLPALVVRDREGGLRAFLNVCRHRGSIVCTGEGRRETLQCPYHAWTYDLDGSLRSAPRADHEPGFDRDGLGLVPLRVDTWGPFVFVNPDPDAADLAEHLGELPELMADGGVDVGALAFHRRAEGEYEANWKICVENYLECYHCSVAHPSFARAIDVAAGAYGLETRPWLLSQFGTARNGGGGVYDATGDIARGQFHLLFPNTAINVMPGRPNLSIGPVVPRGPTRTHRFLDYFFAPDVDPEWVADYLALDDQVGAEDRVLVERVQAGTAAGGIDHGVLLPESERLIAAFQAALADLLAA